MADLNLSLGHRPCKQEGCSRSAGMFGVCSDHEQADVHRLFHQATEAEFADIAPPECFRTEDEWKAYIAASMLTGHASRGVTKRINYCRDCTPAYKKLMMEVGSCAHPETVFIREDGGETTGVALVDRSKAWMWEQAVMGLTGQVVSMPPHEVVGQMLEGLRPAPKAKRGRPRKIREGEA